jgi:hypothetical protein
MEVVPDYSVEVETKISSTITRFNYLLREVAEPEMTCHNQEGTGNTVPHTHCLMLCLLTHAKEKKFGNCISITHAVLCLT